MSKRLFDPMIQEELRRLTKLCEKNSKIEPELYAKYDVKQGLRDINGKGVLAGLTDISEICAREIVNGEDVPCDGKLFYRGIDVEDIIAGMGKNTRYGFEEVTYLLLYGELPTKEYLDRKSVV